MSDWYIGVPRTLAFTLGPLAEGDTVKIDYWPPGILTASVLDATIANRATGACTAPFTPAAAGEYRFWPRVLAAAGSIRNIGRPKIRRVYTPGDLAE